MLQIRRVAGAGSRVVVEVTGQVDLATAPQLATTLAQAQTDGVDQLVVDLTAVDFLDSAGVRVLVVAAQQAAQANVRLSVRGAQDMVARVLEITGVSDYLNVVPEADH